MNYLNPFTLAGIDADKPLDAETVRRSKTRVLNRFELEGTTTVVFEGVEIDRQTAITLLEELTNPEKEALHRTLAQYPELVKFARTAELRHLEESAIRVDHLPQNFVEWFSPWFAPAFGTCLLALVEKGRFNSAYQLMFYRNLVGKQYTKGFGGFLKWVDGIKFQVEKNKYTQAGIAAISSAEIPHLMANLPEVYRLYNDEWGKLLLLRADQLLRIGGNAVAEDLLIHADPLRLSTGVREAIRQKLSDIQKGHARPTTGTRDLPEMDEPLNASDIPWGWVIQGVIVIGMAIMLLRWIF